MLKLSDAGVAELRETVTRYPSKEAALLPALRIAEREFGEISDEAMLLVADLLGVPPARVLGVVSFYTHFRRSGTGKFCIQVCATLPCALRGAGALVEALEKKLDISAGGTTPDGKFTLKKVECIGACNRAPALQVNDTFYEEAALQDLDGFLNALNCEKNHNVGTRPHSFVWRGERAEPTPLSYVPSPKAGFEPTLLSHVADDRARLLDHYLARGGYDGARKALAMKPDELIEFVKKSGLRGRGGAGFPTGNKWSFVPKGGTKPKYVVVNADESEPGTFKDRLLMERDPHVVIEGAIVTAYAVGSRSGYCYIRGEFMESFVALKAAIDEAYAKGFLGKNILGTGFDFDFHLHRGAGAYICGEETGLLTSLEGGRGYPKLKPPFPAVEGLFRCPTVVQNVETLACVPYILTKGIEWFRSMGSEKSPGPKLFCVSGHVNRPGVYELPLGTTLREIIEVHAQGVWKGRALKAVIPGGASAQVLLPKDLDVKMDFDSLGAAGTMLGSAGVVVMDETVCMVDALLNLERFFHHESCGQCTPCREGTGWVAKILKRLEHGEGRKEDVDLLIELAGNMRGKTICALADAAAFPLQSYVPKYRAEFEAHATEKKCTVKTGTPVKV